MTSADGPASGDALSGFDWEQHRAAWSLQEGVTYLNHGSFGPSPLVVQTERERWSRELERQPMDFLVRRLEPLLDDALAALGRFLGSRPDELTFVPNATVGMNIVANNVQLQPGDEVLLTDHEYGAVIRIWGRFCQAAGARTVLARLPLPLTSVDDVVDTLFEQVTDRTKLIVVSHVTSQTATILPVAAICRRARERGIAVCVDGPHAPAQVPVDLREIDCDYYTASLHKWVSAPFGSGFLYVRPRHKQGLKPAITSWGRSLSGRDPAWQDEFHWFGTYDPAPFLAVPAAVRFLEEIGLDRFRQQTHALVRSARERIMAVTGGEPLTADSPDWYGSMVTLPLPNVPRSDAWPGKPHPLQVALWERYRIEVPVFEWQNRLCLRISCHLYNTPTDIDRLVEALSELV
ncbi:Isopenicillin N epimerase [Maioricimonas rarisocia]|uniref:Isopenicillin N epimerase n=1 Tax=Maioricimonas rarisocia TaxID=2528026 RepID=A0A517ZCT9_9PLAN|nr:aminotransferase class V-fold PLP-dependent enzyme [Maioricimonas rarisocia]QDU40279.1 Isopenicillin N epimerase [Maioricimonas rarisocia]